MEADDETAVVTGVDLALVSWVDGPLTDLGAAAPSSSAVRQISIPTKRVGHCLCAKDGMAPTVAAPAKKPAAAIAKDTKTTTTVLVKRPHVVPQVEVFQQAPVTNNTAKQPSVKEPATHTQVKPILSRKNWNSTIDSGYGHNSGSNPTGPSVGGHNGNGNVNVTNNHHQPSCLRRYDSQQSCKSATTLRSYVSTTRSAGGRGHHQRSSADQPSTNSEVGDDALSGLNEKIPGGPGLNEKELWSLHRAVPGLRRHDPRTSTISKHYYVEGGWGWLVTGAAFLVQVLTTGLQLAFGVMAAQIGRHFRGESATPIHMQAVWIGVIQLSGSWMWAPLVVALCRRKSTRLTAVLGGLFLALAALFASFAQQLHQVFLSYGALMSVAMALVRETSALMVGQYFKRRRDFVEIVVQMGAGIGLILFAVFFREALSQMGWRLGLQAATGLLLSAFFLGTFYRSASLYHPQRRAILHLKTQRKKVKVKGKPSNDRPPYFDFSVLRLKSLRMILLSSGIGSIGAYTPLFYLALQGEEDGLESSDLLLIHTFLGLAMSLGTVVVGLVVLRPGPQCLISLQYLCQATLYGIGLSLLALASVNGYHGYVFFAWLYGFCLGGHHYAVHQYTLDRVRARQFARGWSLVLAARALPILFGVPIAGYINQSTPRAGYYFSFTFTVIGASILFLSKMYRRSTPPNLFLGSGNSGRRPSRRESGGQPSNGSQQPEKASQQEPLVGYRPSGNGTIRTVHQDVCTCPHPTTQTTTPSSSSRPEGPVATPKDIGRRIVRKLGLDAIPWRSNPLTEFFSGGGGAESPDDPSPPHRCPSVHYPSHHSIHGDPTIGMVPNAVDYDPAYDPMEWNDEYWNECIDAECCECGHQSCADCGMQLDECIAYEDEDDDVDCQVHHQPHRCQQQQQHCQVRLPDAVDIPELPPEVKRYRAKGRPMRDMSFSAENLPTLAKIGTCSSLGPGYSHYEQGIPRLPQRILRRQHTWHDVSSLTRDVDVIEQITTSV